MSLKFPNRHPISRARFFLKAGYIPAPGDPEPVNSNPVTRATELYYFESPEISATETVRRHLEKTTEQVVYSEKHFA